MHYVYILECNDNRIYIGFTGNLRKRLSEHQNRQVSWTKYRTPVNLISYFAFKDKHKAWLFEKYLKSGSGRAFTKRHLI